MKVLFTVFVLVLSNFLGAFAQAPSWQWGRRGGSNASNEIESIKDIATDPNGNVYILSQVRYIPGGSATTDIAGNAIVGRGAQDAVLSSFTCNGTYRWSKVFGTSNTDVPFSLETDTLGGVYVTMRIYHTAAIGSQADFYVDGDSTIPSGHNKALLLIKYDTAGNYQWIRTPQDAGYSGNQTDPLDMQVDGSGNIFWLCKLYTGSYQNGLYSVASPKIGILKYDKNGLALGGVTMDISTAATTGVYYYSKLFLTRDHKNGRLYVSGYLTVAGFPAMSFGSTNLTNAMFIGAFSATGSSLWTKQNNSTGSGRFLTQVTLDDSSNLYVAGNSLPGDGFAGSNAFTNSYGNQIIVSLFIKLDSNGNLLYVRNSDTKSIVSESHGTYVNGSFIMAGGFTSTVKWPGLNDSVTKKTGGGDMGFYVTRFNAATGQPLALDSLVSVNTTRLAVDIAQADKKGNVHFGGQMDRAVVVAGSTLTAAGNQSTDFFLAKYGYSNCNCVPPTAAITQSNYNNATRAVTFQYTGTTAGVDSVVWTWGNSQSPIRLTGNLMTSSIQRFYGTDTGTYNVCVTAYTNGCGSNKVCTVLRFTPLGVGQLGVAGGERLQLAPNPAAGATEVTYILQGSSGALEVYDLAGRLLSRKAVSGKTGAETLSLTDYVAGVYMVVLREEGREAVYRRLVIAK